MTSVDRERLEGAATPESTRAYVDEMRLRGVSLAERVHRSLGSTGLLVSKVGYGTYRVHADMEEHVRTLIYALLHGCNLIDTSTNYTDGGSERLVGNVLRALVDSRGVSRGQIVVVTKAGYVQGSNLSAAMAREQASEPFPEMVKVAPDLWHCIHPDWLRHQVDQSRWRLGLDHLDVLLLHNPEYYLTVATQKSAGESPEQVRAEFYRRMTESFRQMERFVSEGSISYYGVSSNTFAASGERLDRVSLSAILDCARRAAQDILGDLGKHHFAVAQLPMNLFEPDAVTSKTGARSRTFMDTAREAGIGVLANRPLNAIADGELVRLALPDAVADGEPPLSAVARVAAKERDIVLALRNWRLWDAVSEGMPNELSFRIGETMKSWIPELRNRIQWTQAFEHVIAPAVVEATSSVSAQIDDSRRSEWQNLVREYHAGLMALSVSVTAQVNRMDRDALAPLSERLRVELGDVVLDRPLSQIALNAVASVPGVTSVLTGMRRDPYVLDALQVLAQDDFADPLAAFRAAERGGTP